MKTRFFLLPLTIVLLLGLFTSCEQLLLEDTSTDNEAIFKEAWTFLKEEYSFFELRGTDWAQQRNIYQSQVTPESSEGELFSIISNMLNDLRDRHTSLCNGRNCSEWEWRQSAPANFDYALIRDHYFNASLERRGPYEVVDLGEVGYVYISSFDYKFKEDDIAPILRQFQDHRGLIIDIRDNGGGEINSYEKLAGYFTNQKRTVGRQRYKNGPGPNDFSEWEDLFIEPTSNEIFFLRPIVLLTNRGSYSAATLFAQTMKAIPNVTVMGDTTGGGGGLAARTELANGWLLSCSNTQFVGLDDYQAELGAFPDIQVDMDSLNISLGIDDILEAAILELTQ